MNTIQFLLTIHLCIFLLSLSIVFYKVKQAIRRYKMSRPALTRNSILLLFLMGIMLGYLVREMIMLYNL